MPQPLSIVAIVPAAGIGSRMQQAVPKQYLALGARCVLEHSLEVLLEHPQLTKLVVALHPDDRYFTQLAVAKHPKVQTTIGGASRAETVARALAAVEVPEATWALVHDAARPCLTRTDLDALLAQVEQNPEQGAILATPVKDSMKQVEADGQVSASVDRNGLWHALTPQIFPWQALQEALRQASAAGFEVTDEASAMTYAGHRVQCVQGRSDNLKVTHPEDLQWVTMIKAVQEANL